MSNVNITNKLFLSFFLIFSFSFSAFAQEVEEVVVTATKKEESIQDIAVSIQAFDADSLAAEQIYDLSDLAEVVPGFGVSKSIGSGSAFIVRGIGSFGIGAAVTSSIVAAVNGHSVSESVMSDLGFIDLERVEVLKGPQGTKFGRNSVAGVINLVTARPTDELGGYVDYEVGSLDRNLIKGAINVPISNDVRMRLAFASNTREGIVTNEAIKDYFVQDTTEATFDDRNDQAIRLSLDWDINDITELKFTYSGQKSEDNRPQEEVSFCQPDQFFGCSPWERGPINASADSRGIGAGFFGFFAALYPSTITNGYGNSPRSTDFGSQYLNRIPMHYQEAEFTNLQLDRQLNDNLLLTAKYTYETRRFMQMNDNDGSISVDPLLGAGQSLGLPPIVADLCFGTPNFGFCESVDSDRSYDFSDVFMNGSNAEINIISDYDGPFNFTAGLYFYDNRNDNEYRVQTTGTQFIGSFALHPYYPVVTNLLGVDFGGKGGVPFYQGLLPVVGLANAAITAQTMLAMGLPISALQAAQLQAFSDGVDALEALPDVIVPFDIRGTLSDQHVRTYSRALYGEMYYDLNDTTKLTLGLRFDMLGNKTATYDGGILSGDWLRAGGFLYENRMDVPGLVTAVVQEEDTVNGMIAIQKYLQDDVMVYGSYTTASKSAGLNAGNNPVPYDKEETSVLDLGLRAKFLDGAMLLNMNVFKNDNKGMLVATIRDTQSFNNNVDAEITGFEGEMNVFLSDTTQLQFSWLLVDAEITDAPAVVNYLNPLDANSVAAYLGPVDSAGAGFVTGAVMDNGQRLFKSAGFNCTSPFFAPAGGVDCPASLGVPVSIAGNPLPGTADLSYSLSLTQLYPGENGVTSARLSYRYRDETNSDPFNYSRFDIPEQKTWDGLVKYTPNNADWHLGLYVKNIADDQTLFYLRSGSNIQGGQLYGNFSEPRTFGLQFGMSF